MKESPKSGRLLRLLFWESTIKCNLACGYCRRIETDETSDKDLSTAQGKDLIEQLADLGKAQSLPMACSIMPILVFSGGEPLCRSDIFELIKYAGTCGLAAALATNATLIDADLADRIKASGVMRVSVSLDGATAEVHNKMRSLEGAFERAIVGIGYLREKGVPFQINLTLTKYNADQLEDVYKLARSLGAAALHIFMLVPVGCGVSLADSDMLSPQGYEQKMVEIFHIEKRGLLQIKVTCGPHYERVVRQQGGRAKMQQGHHHSGHKVTSRGCLAGIGVLFVGHQGDVFPCGYLPVNCGNILEERLLDIWQNSKDLAKMRDSEQLEGKCGICEYRQVCGGCRGRAYSATGNYMAEEPFCAYKPMKK